MKPNLRLRLFFLAVMAAAMVPLLTGCPKDPTTMARSASNAAAQTLDNTTSKLTADLRAEAHVMMDKCQQTVDAERRKCKSDAVDFVAAKYRDRAKLLDRLVAVQNLMADALKAYDEALDKVSKDNALALVLNYLPILEQTIADVKAFSNPPSTPSSASVVPSTSESP